MIAAIQTLMAGALTTIALLYGWEAYKNWIGIK
jgi:hypothetical protein